MSAARAKGTRWESAIVDYVRPRGAPHAERRALNGAHDKGDIAGIVGVVIEAKSAARLELAAWVAEAEAEVANAAASIGLVWAKRKGKASPGDGYVVMTGATAVRLLQMAGLLDAAVAEEAPH